MSKCVFAEHARMVMELDIEGWAADANIASRVVNGLDDPSIVSELAEYLISVGWIRRLDE